MCPLRHRLQSKRHVGITDLAAEPFIALSSGSPFRAAVDRLFEGAGLQPAIVAEVRTQRAICNMVAAGAGVSIIDPSVARDYAPRHLAAIEVRPRQAWAVVALTPRRTIPSQATRALLSDLVGAARKGSPADSPE